MTDTPTQEDKDAALLRRLYNEDPEVRRLIQTKVKKQNPGAVFPELEAEERVAAATKTFGEQLEKTNERIEQTNLRLTRQQKHEAWRKQGLDPELVESTIDKYGLTGTKDMPVEKAAMVIIEAEQSTAGGSTPNVREAGRMTLDKDWMKVSKANDSAINAFAQDAAHKAVDEIIAFNQRNNRGRRAANGGYSG